MTESFNAVWKLLSNRLIPGTEIRNLTAYKGYLGDTMKVVKVDEKEIVIQAPKAANLLHISRKKLERVWEIWPAYKAGKMPRRDVCDMTFHSKYIISILNWLEENGS
jgi:hypothetical protein